MARNTLSRGAAIAVVLVALLFVLSSVPSSAMSLREMARHRATERLGVTSRAGESGDECGCSGQQEQEQDDCSCEDESGGADDCSAQESSEGKLPCCETPDQKCCEGECKGEDRVKHLPAACGPGVDTKWCKQQRKREKFNWDKYPVAVNQFLEPALDPDVAKILTGEDESSQQVLAREKELEQKAKEKAAKEKELEESQADEESEESGKDEELPKDAASTSKESGDADQAANGAGAAGAAGASEAEESSEETSEGGSEESSEGAAEESSEGGAEESSEGGAEESSESAAEESTEGATDEATD